MPAKGDALVYQIYPNRGDGGPHPVVNGVAPSSFGMEATTLGPQYSASSIVSAQRRAELEFRERYYKCRQHDWKTNDFNGSITPSGRNAMTQPMLSSNAATPSYFVPLSKRRPSNPVRIGRKIVGAFTNMLFSHGRWPQMRSADPDTQDWAEALSTAASLPVEFTRARNAGGGCGIVGMSWGWFDGKPRVKVHEGKFLHVLEWKDEDRHIPKHVTELWVFEKPARDKRTGRTVMKPFYHRRDWTELADVVFRDVEVPEKGEEPLWVEAIDPNASHVHNHGVIHFEWIANLPDDDVESDDGQPDYAETYEQQDTLDTLNSVVSRGACLNLDPTLKLKVEQELVDGGIVRKGSDNALIVGEKGDADYLELEGTSIVAGMNLVAAQKLQILETCECVLTDPDKAAASGQSSVALKIIYAPMIAKCDVMRGQYGGAIERIVNGLTDEARRYMPDQPGQDVVTPDYEEPANDGADLSEEVQFDDEGNELPPEEDPDDGRREFFVNLPPREEVDNVLDEKGQPTGEQRIVVTTRKPGKGAISLEWGEYFKPTADDMQKGTASISTAAGGKPVMSQRTAVELTANLYNRDPNNEWVAVTRETRESREHELAASAGMFPGTGGQVADPSAALPEDSSNPPHERPGEDGDLTDQDIKDTLTVNEARAQRGYGPLLGPGGAVSPDGFLTLAEFNARVGARGTVEGETDAGAPPPDPNAAPTVSEKPFGGGPEAPPPPKPKAEAPVPPKPPAA